MAVLVFIIHWLRHFAKAALLVLVLPTPEIGTRRKAKLVSDAPCTRHPPKPEWVRKEVIRLKALMPHDGCRKIAGTFNRLYRSSRSMTVGKTYVYNTIKRHRYEIQVLRRKIKNRKPRPLSKNLTWAIDLTQVRDSDQQVHTLFGVVDSGTRACLSLEPIKTKASVALLRVLLNTIEHYGKPKAIRTDNEAVFVSRLFRIALWLLGVKHQRTEKCCPWMNGKVERFFGTLKAKLKNHAIGNSQCLIQDLAVFRLWYNHIRPHQHLNSRTPAEVWNCQQPNSKGRCFYLSEWQGALTGFYLPPT